MKVQSVEKKDGNAKIVVTVDSEQFEAAVNRAIRETLVPLAEDLAARTGARIVPVHAVYPCTAARLPDSTHPDAIGARILAETVFQALQR